MTTQLQSKPITGATPELEAHVSHLLVVGGRAMRGKPPGARVEPPPKKPARGRESDTLFVLITAAGSLQSTATFYEELARLSGERYFRATASITSALREMITGLNSHLIARNNANGEHFQVNMAAMVLRGREIFIARVGACICLVRQGDDFTSAPDDLHDELALNGLPLGYSDSPDIKLARFETSPGQVLILSDSGLAAAERELLAAALAGENTQTIVDGLKPLAGALTQAMIIEFRIGEQPVQPPAPIKATEIAPLPNVIAVAAAPTSISVSPLVAVPIGETKPDDLSTPAVDLHKAPDPIPRTPRKNPITRLIAGIVWFLRGLSRFLNAILDRVLPEPKEGAPNIATSTAAGIAILIPVIVIFVMVAFRLSQVDATNFEQLVSQIQSQANEAASTPRTDEDKAKTLWFAVMQRIEIAELQHPGDSTLGKIRSQAQAALDEFGKVTRKAVIPLRSYGNTASLGGVLIQGGTDLYAFDRTSSAVYRDTLRQPDQLSGQRGQTPIYQVGTALGGNSVQKIIDFLWMDEGGIRTSHALVGLDAGGFLVTYSPAFPPAQSQVLPGSERWKNPVALRVWQEKLYILDPGANQIWRYQPSGVTYPNPPEEYFELEYQRNLSNAVDFSIDTKGAVYVVFANGTMKKYIAGAEQNFALNGVPEGGLRSANSVYLDTSSALATLYVTDPIDQALYEFTLAGTFQNRFKPSDPAAFKRMSSVFVQGTSAYVTDGNLIYYLDLARK